MPGIVGQQRWEIGIASLPSLGFLDVPPASSAGVFLPGMSRKGVDEEENSRWDLGVTIPAWIQDPAPFPGNLPKETPRGCSHGIQRRDRDRGPSGSSLSHPPLPPRP